MSETAIQQTYSTSIASQSKESLREQFPNLSETEIQTLHDVGKKDGDNQIGKCDLQEKVCKYQPWQDLEQSLDNIIDGMDDAEKHILIEMNKAHENSSFLSNTQTRLKTMPKSPTDMFNIADGFVRRIIKVAKQLNYFRLIDKDDQIALLKGSVVEIMMLRSAVNFDVKTETWNLNTTSCIKSTRSEGASDLSSPSSACSNSEQLKFSPPPSGLDINQLREAAMRGADINTLRNMAAKQSSVNASCDSGKINAETLRQKYGLSIDQMKVKCGSSNSGETELDSLRNSAKSAGFDINALRHAAMNGASFDQLSQMAHSGGAAGLPEVPLGTDMKQETYEETVGTNTSISSDILKLGNSETKAMFLTYSRFIKSLMCTIYGDLMILKFLIMLSLFSPDRPGIENQSVVENYQELYANAMKKYIEIRFPEEKNMFARCIMKLTDLRNVNEIHTKMLLKMHVEDIEPLLIEIFDLPQ